MEEIRKVAFCPHCGNKATQKLIHSHRCSERVWLIWDELDADEESQIDATYFVSICETCQGILLYGAFDEYPEDESFHQTKLLWPESAFPTKLYQIVSLLFTTKRRELRIWLLMLSLFKFGMR